MTRCGGRAGAAQRAPLRLLLLLAAAAAAAPRLAAGEPSAAAGDVLRSDIGCGFANNSKWCAVAAVFFLSLSPTLRLPLPVRAGSGGCASAPWWRTVRRRAGWCGR
jgi:hypothetical protein